jgi:hypothetical protein
VGQIQFRFRLLPDLKIQIRCIPNPSNNRGGRCHAAREGSGVGDYLAA